MSLCDKYDKKAKQNEKQTKQNNSIWIKAPQQK